MTITQRLGTRHATLDVSHYVISLGNVLLQMRTLYQFYRRSHRRTKDLILDALAAEKLHLQLSVGQGGGKQSDG